MSSVVAPKRSKPLNIEEILAQKKAADEAASKPKFVSRKERERLALERREKELQENGNGHRTPSSISSSGALNLESKFKSLPTNGTHRPESRAMPTGPAAMGGTQRQAKPVTVANGTAKRPSVPSYEDKTQALTRERYMGPAAATSTFSATKKRKRTTDKKFNFDWDGEEDTTKSLDPYLQPDFGLAGGCTHPDYMSKVWDIARQMEDRDPVNGREAAQAFLKREGARVQAALADKKVADPEQASYTERRFGIGKHWTDKRLEDMRERDWRIFKEDFQISTRGGGIPNPMRSWSESGLPKRLLDIVDQVGYKDPSPVQRAAIPIALQSRDLIGVAVTGSGKTAAFLLPLLVYISELPAQEAANRMDGPYAIILAPTRELAQQIELEAKKFATPLGFTCVSLVGGHSIEEQAYNMRDGAEIIIATPGRLVDCIERRVLVLGRCCYIIMDEADRMIDMGFEEPVNKILSALPVSNQKPDTDDAEDAYAMSRHIGGIDRYRQTMMYTATMPAAVERIARNYLRRPAIVTIGNTGEAVDTVEQRVEFLQGEDKRKKRLNEILSSRQFAPPIIIFVNIKRNCDVVARDIQRMGFNSVTLHGSKNQEQREAALQGLKDRKYDVLVATDLAGRGIDVQDVSLVINFNMAPSIEAYTHRIGRTGRAGKSGVAITFLGNEDNEVLYDLRKMIQGSAISSMPEALKKHEAAQQPRSKGGVKKVEESGGFGGKGGWA